MQFKVMKTDNPLISKAFIAVHGRWFVSVRNNQGYLHSDGQVWGGTLNPMNSRYTGWYKTREAARQAIRRYKAGP